jgi:four helix bundle protein
MDFKRKTNILSIQERTFNFAVEIVKLSAELRGIREFELSNQLIRSGTSIGANVREAFNGFSNKDYLFKLSIAQKEADETIYWLEIINTYLGETKLRSKLLDESKQILKILRTMILNKKANLTMNNKL